MAAFPWANPALALLVGAACAPAPVSRDLSREFDPTQVRVSSGANSPFVRYESIRDLGGEYLKIPVGDGTARPWGSFLRPNVARAYVPSLATLADWQPGDPLPRLFDAAGQSFEFSHWWTLDPDFQAEPGELKFTALGAELLVWGEPDQVGPLELQLPVQRGERVDERWRTQLGTLVADGFQLWPGEQWPVQLKGTGPKQLTFLFAVHGHAVVDPEDNPCVTWRIHFDGEPLFEGDVAVVPGLPVWAPVDLTLPRKAGELSFSVEGVGARMAFLVPRVSSPKGRGQKSLDVSIFLADTFRADLVGQKVGGRSLTPHLDIFAQSAVSFRRARSPSSWTLPAHASMFTGLQPTTHGALEYEDQLASEAPRLAERLSAMGYRTVAITNGGFVSRAFGLDRGFEFFFEHRSDNHLEGLIDLVPIFLDLPDPRPLFLFFHTYRAHDPYWLEPATRTALEPHLPLGREWPELIQVLLEVAPKVQHGEALPPGHEHELEELRALYRGGAMDVDRGFARWLALLDQSERNGVVIFTSDHGDAFGERDGRVGHHLGPFEDQLRVPLIVRAKGLPPAVVDGDATIMDLPRTIFDLLNLSPSPEWQGRSLLARNARNPSRDPIAARNPGAQILYTEPTQVAWIEGSRKLIALGDELEDWRVYEIDADPLELTNRGDFHRAWATARIEQLLQNPTWRNPKWTFGPVHLSPNQKSQLDVLGYTGG